MDKRWFERGEDHVIIKGVLDCSTRKSYGTTIQVVVTPIADT